MHLDLLAYLRRIHGYVGNVAQAVVRRRERDDQARARE
jgi:hypothetical protein